MITMPVVQLRQQYAKLGVEREPGNLELHQPPTQLEMTTTQPVLETQSNYGKLIIDQNRARNALGIGPNTDFMDRVTDEAHRLALEGIARIVDEGNQAAAIHKGNFDVFADLAWQHSFDDFKINYEGPFEADNVDIDYDWRPAEIHYTAGSTAFNYRWSPTEINYTPAKVSIYLAQQPGLEIIPPQIDMKA